MLENNTGCGAIILIIGIILGGIASGVALSDKIKAKISNVGVGPPPNDLIHFSNSSSFKTGVLVDGSRDSFAVNDESHEGIPGADISGFYFTDLPGEVIGFASNPGSPPFTSSLPPTLKTPSDTLNPLVWTSGMDTVTFVFENEYAINISVWIIFGDFASQQASALEAIRKTVEIWTREGQGIRFQTPSIINATDHDDEEKKRLEDLLANDPDFLLDCEHVGSLRDNDRFAQNMINVYYVPRVRNLSEAGSGARAGTRCEGHNILMGNNASIELLAHEIGHAFSLDHVDSFTSDFDTSNVMHSASMIRNYLTEGQTFRSVVNRASAINEVSFYNKRPGLAQRTCSNIITIPAPDDCPELQKRIWTP